MFWYVGQLSVCYSSLASYFFSLHSQLVVILSFGGEEGCVSRLYEMLEREGGW